MKKLLIFLVLMLPLISFGQTYQIEATDDPSPVIRTDVSKIPEPARTKDTVLPAPNFTYGIQSKRYTTSFGIDTIKAAKMGSEPLPKLYRTYAKIGVGNYSSFMGELSVMSVRSKNGAWGIHFGHWSAGSGPKSVAGEYSGFSNQNVDLFGKRFTKKHELSAGFGFDRNVVYNYGSAVESNVFTKDYTRQKYNFYNTELGVKSFYSDSEAVNHNVRFGFQHFDNRFGVTEDRVLLNATAGRYIRTEYLDAKFGIDYNRVSGFSDTANSTILSFEPKFTAQLNKMHVAAGIGLFHETDGPGATYFSPTFYFSYDIVNHIIIPYLSLGGSLSRNNYHSLAATNPFVSSLVATQLRNTRTKFELEIGLKGSLSSQVFYQVSASRKDVTNMPFFVNTTFAEDVLQNKFMAVYDGATIVHVGGQLGWQQRERIKLVVGGDWFQYSMNTELKPWHTPTLKLNLLAYYNIQDVILVYSEIYYLNGQYARTGAAGSYGVKNLKGLVDVNLGVEYKYNKFLSLYVDFRNIGAQRYERWNGYPTQKFNLMGGLTYTF